MPTSYKKAIAATALAVAAIAVFRAVFFSFPAAASESQIKKQPDNGEYIFTIAGCAGCHTDRKNNGAPLAGGREFKTDYGVFYSPNITQDTTTGIGTWNLEDFTRAMRKGTSPAGEHYYPAFPYTSYRLMTDDDLLAIWNYLKKVPGVVRKNTPHSLKPPFGWRFLAGIWKMLFLDERTLAPDPGKAPGWNRGRYVVEALAHCGECHSPRNFLGAVEREKAFSGTSRNPEGISVPNITSDRETGIGKWSASDLDMLLTIGMLPNADFVGGVMAEAITHASSHLTPDDRRAVIDYLMGIKPISNRVKGTIGNGQNGGWN